MEMLAMRTRCHKIIAEEHRDELPNLTPGQLAQRVIDYLTETYVRPEQEQTIRQITHV
jgi:hypothetical protein